MTKFGGVAAAVIIGAVLGIVILLGINASSPTTPAPQPTTTTIVETYSPEPGEPFYDEFAAFQNCVTSYLSTTGTLDLILYSPADDPLVVQALEAADAACINASAPAPAPPPE